MSWSSSKSSSSESSSQKYSHSCPSKRLEVVESRELHGMQQYAAVFHMSVCQVRDAGESLKPTPCSSSSSGLHFDPLLSSGLGILQTGRHTCRIEGTSAHVLSPAKLTSLSKALTLERLPQLHPGLAPPSTLLWEVAGSMRLNRILFLLRWFMHCSSRQSPQAPRSA